MNTKQILIFLLFICSLSSCFKEELPVSKSVRDGLSQGEFDMGSTYDSSFYFSILNKNIPFVINKYDWHLGLWSGSNNPHIIINTGVSMKVYSTTCKSISEFNDTNSWIQNPLIDYPSGDIDSLALTDALNLENIYIVDLGKNKDLQNTGFKLLKVSFTNDEYIIESWNIDKSNHQISELSLNSDKQYILFNLLNNKSILEPKSKDWDIQFKQYLHIYYNPFQTYSVVGCFINSERVKAYEYKGNKIYNNIDFNDLNFNEFKSLKNTIGFAWKHFNINDNVYTVYPNKTYFLSIDNLKLFKLHFIGYYNEFGEKGKPQFEFKEL